MNKISFFLVLIIGIFAYGCEGISTNGVSTEDSIEEIKEYILKADSLRSIIDYDITNEVIGKYDGIDVVKIKSDYSDYDAVNKLMGDYFSDEMIEEELHKIYLTNLDGYIGCIAADGENFYYMNNESEFSLIYDSVDKKTVNIQMFNDAGEDKYVSYTISQEEGQWKIINQETQYNRPFDITKIVYIYDWDRIEYSSNEMIEFFEVTSDSFIEIPILHSVNAKNVGEWVKLSRNESFKISGFEIINLYVNPNDEELSSQDLYRVEIEFSNGKKIHYEASDDESKKHQKIDFESDIETNYLKLKIVDINDTIGNEAKPLLKVRFFSVR